MFKARRSWTPSDREPIYRCDMNACLLAFRAWVLVASEIPTGRAILGGGRGMGQ